MLLLWPISIVSGGFEQTERGKKEKKKVGGGKAEMRWSYGVDG